MWFYCFLPSFCFPHGLIKWRISGIITHRILVHLHKTSGHDIQLLFIPHHYRGVLQTCTTQPTRPWSDHTQYSGFFNLSQLTLYKPSTRSYKSKFGNAPISYYSNCVASFNIELDVCGDIESNPGPTASSNLLPSIQSTLTSQPSALSETTLGLSSKSTLSAVLFNARSIVNKLLLFQTELDVYKYDLVFITESWLDNSIHDGELSSDCICHF